ncbi:PepSY domain-containing protein [Rubellimicrobium arenae]|uniref:PepSY domain-containing protein n=1 Tax=Rubellimicrobium arenae TaxID=2817372 RepID=UPI001B3070D6|nr:PepSY domain-containing protein [Rubellimicrobium arenae]
MTTRSLIATLALALALGATGARAEDEASVEPAKEAQIRDMFVKQGYEVRSVGTEDGKIEVYAVKDGKLYEIYLDENLKVLESEED